MARWGSRVETEVSAGGEQVLAGEVCGSGGVAIFDG